MDTDKIRQLVMDAQLFEHENGLLEDHVSHKIEEITQAINLPGDNQHRVVSHFIDDYVAQVPELLDRIAIAAKKAGIQDYVAPFLEVASEYFLREKSEQEVKLGLMGLLDESYFAHRLFEELNDKHIQHVGMPLIPIDTTLANVIVHQILGEDFATSIDGVVEEIVSAMMPAENAYDQEAFKLYLEKIKPDNIESVFQQWQWPSLTDCWGFEIRLPA